MISWFRKLAQSWVSRILFLLLVLSFGIWGIEDVVRNIWRESAVVRMEGGNIEVPEAQSAARRELQRIQRQLGPSFEADAAIREAVARQALEGLIGGRAQRLEASRLGVSVPDDQVAEYVRSIPSFQTAGRFDRMILDQFLRQNDMNEAMFLQLVRDDLQRIQLVGAVRAGAPAPASLARALFDWEAEQRVAQVVELPLVDAPEPAAPTEAQIERFYTNNPQQFSTPELREAVVAVLSADVLADQVEVPEEELRQAYEARRSQFETPEKRAIEQALLPTEDAAKAIASAWAQNPDFAAVRQAAQAAGGSAAALGTLARDDLPLPELAAAAFAAPDGGVTQPVRSPFGWHVLRVTGITPGTTVPFEQASDQLREEMALEKAADLAFDRANKVEDAIAGGATLEEAARRYGMAVATVRTDARGNDAEGGPVGLPVPVAGRPETLRLIFTTEPGRAPRLQELRQGEAFVAIEVRAVVPPAVKPLAEVEADVRLAFLTDARKRFQEERAGALMAAMREGKTLAQAAEAAGIPSERVGPFGRQPDQGAPGVAPELLPILFNIRVNEPAMIPTAQGFAVAQLLEIIRPDPATVPGALENARRTAQAQAAEDLEIQFANALRNRAAPRISPTVLQQVIP
ncbi:SurA N-terminal domain-containing protein [Falsiroseomonas sp. HW251]|uniref:peptidylprolyl isomerase n=1 Tax=Falsiroseomonas sp. HW251 TaxID=3390998 RepID=UPI003D32029E